MEVGSISIVGKLDVSSITDSLNQLNSGFGKVKDVAKNSFGDIANLSKGLGSVTTGLAGIGLAAGTALVGLAAVGPYTAGAMARINVSMGELERTVSGALAPAFENFADMFSDFSDWASSPEGIGMLGLVNDTLIKMEGAVSNVFYWLDKLRPAAETAGNAMKGFLDVVFPTEDGKPSINTRVKEDITKNAPSNILSSIGTGGFLGSTLGFLGGAGATALLLPGMIMGGLSGLINSIVEPMNKGIVTGMLTSPDLNSLREQQYESYRSRGQDTAILDELWGKLGDYGYKDTNDWAGNYSSEQQLTQEMADKSGYSGRYTGD